ncbi:MAG TPA: HDIG domain-containing metalloprotein [Thermoleophilaceae bacterium]
MARVDLSERLGAEPVVRIAREALGGSGVEEVWVVGGAVRDALLGAPVLDLDLTVRGDSEQVARKLAGAVGGPVFPLSEEFGAWRAMDRERVWTCDVTEMHGEGIDADLARRDFSVNAIAVPLDGGEAHDPQGGITDLDAGVLRVLGGPDVEHSAYADDPLRPLRLARFATELNLRPEPETERLTREAAPLVAGAAAERVFAELRRIVSAERVLDGLDLCDHLGLTAVVLPELYALHGVEQSHFHHLDVYDHSIEVLRCYLAIEHDPEGVFGELAEPLDALMRETFADELSGWHALRFAALLHDSGKPATRGVRPDGRVTFIGHDKTGADMIRALCRRLKTSERLRELLAGVTRHHLVLGFLVHEMPLGRGRIYQYMERCQPVEVEVTLLTCADRLATRGKNAEDAIKKHLELARVLMGEALAWRNRPPEPPLRGGELAEELGIEPGPELGELLSRLREARFTGEAETREEAVALARRLREDNPAR